MNHYKVLGVHKFSSDVEIKSAYGALARQFHPDHHANDPVKAARMSEINVAYNALKNDKSRRAYDRTMMFLKPCATCGGKAVIWKQKGFNKKIAVPCKSCKGTGAIE